MHLRPAIVFCTTHSENYIAQHMEIRFQPIGASPQFVHTGTANYPPGWGTTSMEQDPQLSRAQSITFAAQEMSRNFMEPEGKVVFTRAHHRFIY
jgi:hypothetical protein